jgi:putative transposase
MTTPARTRYSGYRFPVEIISHAVWLCFRFPLGLCMVEELLAARGIIVTHDTVRQWARKFGQQLAVGSDRCHNLSQVSRQTLRWREMDSNL